jgi:hypothetical protein
MSATQLQEKLKNSTSGVIAGKLDLVAIQRLIKQINDEVVQPAYLQAQQDGVIETDRTILADVVKRWIQVHRRPGNGLHGQNERVCCSSRSASHRQ